MASLVEELADVSEPALRVATKVKAEVEHFLKSDVLLLALLANPGLKERHWDQMAEIVGYSLPHSASSSLSEMLQIGLDGHLEAIEAVCVQASKEYNLEKALQKMHFEWEGVCLELKEYVCGSGAHFPIIVSLTGFSLSSQLQADTHPAQQHQR